ncbi:hypothetical protein SCOCK_690025 [Actinacidiphila cocklensis]|uniref:Uncharacterized protein n=1 Tax=Actinacidiphila cocklensis TaxID=887465 RepID=A0A9W4GUM4_9ACTN|nr:hypothetical protein SCOCK_690025 [Actinacidiphila cocklensis]
MAPAVRLGRKSIRPSRAVDQEPGEPEAVMPDEVGATA